MKTTILPILILFVLVLSSCSSVYKTGQTPDDVYYSPTRGVVEEEKEEVSSRNNPDDRYLRMKVANRNRWASIDDFNYWNDTRFDYCNRWNYNNNYNWGYSYMPSWNNYWGFYSYHPSRFGWGGWYNPVYTIIGYKSPVVASGYSANNNLAAYKNTKYNNNTTYVTDPKTGVKTPVANNNSLGSLLRKVVIPSSSSSSSNNGSTTVDKPVRTFTPNTTPQSNAGGTSGGTKSTGSSSSSGRKPRG